MGKHGIFFSNRTVDQPVVDGLQAALTEALPNLPFEDMSKGIPPSDQWKVAAEAQIDASVLFVCILGATTHTSEPIDWEIREAHRRGIPIILARLDSAKEVPGCCSELRIHPVDWELDSVAGLIGEQLVERVLFSGSGAADLSPDIVWNQYNLMTQSWEALIARRQTVNTVYISATAALLASIGALVAAFNLTTPIAGVGSVALMAGLGTAMSYNWRKTLISYGLLSRAKSKVVGALEAHLPARLFDAEWSILEARKYRSTTQTDTQTAQFFMLLFAAIVFVSVGLLLSQLIYG